MADKKKDAEAKLAEYKDLIAKAKANEGRDDPALMAELKQLEREAAAIEKDLKGINDKERELKDKRNQLKKLIDSAYENPDKFTPQEIDNLLDTIQEQKELGNDQIDENNKINDDLEQRIKDLEDLLNKNQLKKGLENQIKDVANALKDDFNSLKDVLKKLPERIQQLLNTLNEMKLGSGPDESADYWEEREKIDEHTNNLKGASKELEKVE